MLHKKLSYYYNGLKLLCCLLVFLIFCQIYNILAEKSINL